LLFEQSDYYAQAIPLVAGSIVALLASTGSQHDLGRTLGGMSFSFYLNTWVMFFAVNYGAKLLNVTGQTNLLLAIGLALATGFSYLHYLAIDRKIVEVRSAFFNRKRGWAACFIGLGLVFSGTILGLVLQSQH
jgi:peptidoglycan/LPS O-acetylase OafA/YrhL